MKLNTGISRYTNFLPNPSLPVNDLLIRISSRRRNGHRKLVPQLSGLKQKQFTSVRPHDDPLVGHPSLGEVVLWLCLLEGKLLQVALAVAVQLEDAVADHAYLGVVLGVKGYLENRR